MRTAFPWCPKTTWRYDTTGTYPLWRVSIRDPSDPPIWLNAVHGQGATPRQALRSLLSVVEWWLDYDGRRGGTAAEVFGAHASGGRRGQIRK